MFGRKVVALWGILVVGGMSVAQARATSRQMSCPDGCEWTLICEDMDYVCGQNPDRSFMWCTKTVCYDKCDNCPNLQQGPASSSFDLSGLRPPTVHPDPTLNLTPVPVLHPIVNPPVVDPLPF